MNDRRLEKLRCFFIFIPNTFVIVIEDRFNSGE
jgi:hypothetical protein